MANKPLKTIQFPGLSDTYTIPQKVSDLTNDLGFVSTFLVTLTYDETNSHYTSDKTYAEIAAAIAKGYDILLYDENSYFPYQGTNAIFSDRYIAHNFYTTRCDWSNTITTSGYYITSDSVNTIYETRTIPVNVSDLINNVNYATSSEVSAAITSAIGGINSFDVAVVTALPTQNIKDHTIYFVAKESETNDVYDEYMYISNAWEKIGNTAVSLDGYATESYVDAAVASVSAAIPNVYDWALASSKPTYTYTEVGALSADTHIPNDQVNADWSASTGISSILNKPDIPTIEDSAAVISMLQNLGLDTTTTLIPATTSDFTLDSSVALAPQEV